MLFRSKCPYCDFNTYAGIEALMPAYVGALEREVGQWGAWLGRPPLTSLFFGGGTPSYLPTSDLGRLLIAINAAFDPRSGIEATIEANPGDCDPERVAAFRSVGFNRISIGVQSFDDVELRLLGRRHTALQAARAVDAARRAGFGDVSIDLMFGLPDQHLAAWRRTLEAAADLDVDHLSAYALTIEPGTPLEAEVRLGRTPTPDPDVAADMYTLAQSLLSSAGFVQYEISNWAKPGRANVHNLTYWRGGPYLGVGPGAHSYLSTDHGGGPFGVRFANADPPRAYIERVNAWTAPPTSAGAERSFRARLDRAAAIGYCEQLGRRTAMAETMMMGLRLNAGVSDGAFRARFGEGIADAFPDAVRECVNLGLLEWADGMLRLTESGRLLANEAFQRFVGSPSEDG